MANSRVLTGEVRDNHLLRLRVSLNHAAMRLDLPVAGLLVDLDKTPEIMVFNLACIKCEPGVWACDAMIYVKFIESDQAKLGFYAECEVNWSASSRSISQATVALSVYQRAVEMAAIIEGLIS